MYGTKQGRECTQRVENLPSRVESVTRVVEGRLKMDRECTVRARKKTQDGLRVYPKGSRVYQ